MKGKPAREARRKILGVFTSKYEGNTKENEGETGARSAPEDFGGIYFKIQRKYKGNEGETGARSAPENLWGIYLKILRK